MTTYVGECRTTKLLERVADWLSLKSARRANLKKNASSVAQPICSINSDFGVQTNKAMQVVMQVVMQACCVLHGSLYKR